MEFEAKTETEAEEIHEIFDYTKTSEAEVEALLVHKPRLHANFCTEAVLEDLGKSVVIGSFFHFSICFRPSDFRCIIRDEAWHTQKQKKN